MDLINVPDSVWAGAGLYVAGVLLAGVALHIGQSWLTGLAHTLARSLWGRGDVYED